MGEAVELARALTGETLPVMSADPTVLIEDLAALGWDRARLADLRATRQQKRLPWPFPVDHQVVREIGFARFEARLAELREQLGLGSQVRCAHVVDRPLDAEERRLAAERPPHWG